MNHELLVPAGDMACLHQAVYNGADAVYISGMNFGARKFANNFTNEEIIEALKFCHLYGVKVYVTMNTLVKNNEVDDFINQARLDGGKILIHCKLGISRSAAIIIAYLIKYYGLNFNSALKFIKKQRDRINPNKGFMEQLKKYENMVQTKIKRK